MASLSTQVLATVAYCDQFQFPLTLKEIHWRLVWQPASSKSKPEPEQVPSLAKVRTAVESLVKHGQLARQGLYFQLASSPNWQLTRDRRTKESERKWSSALELVAQAKRIPWIQGIAVTGSLAMNNAQPDADIDFMIVTEPGRLWLTRLWVTLLAVRAGRRRSWHAEEPESWCFNLWLDSDHLAMPKTLQSVYGAYEVVQAEWVFDRAQIAARFYAANSWIKNWLPAASADLLGEKEPLPVRPPAANPILNWLEKVVFSWQFHYMKPHMTRERVGESWAFFHPRDTKKQVEAAWRRAWKDTP